MATAHPGDDIPPALRDGLIAYLLCDSPDRARIISELVAKNPGIANLLMDLEADDDSRARLEIELLRSASSRQA
jgi:hypothetical protein